MKRLVYVIISLLLLSMTFLAGRWYSPTRPADGAATGRRILYYVDPMNPAHTSGKPGIAPCGMKMEPVYADGAPSGQASVIPPASMRAGTVKITPEKQQIIGIRTAVVEKNGMDRVIRTTGRVAADETRVYRLIAPLDGWIRETYDKGSGVMVKKDERLAAFYNPQFLVTEQSYFFALNSVDRSQPGTYSGVQGRPGLKQSVESLESLGMSESQIKELADAKQLTDKIYIVAPATAFILSRNVSQGQRFDKGTEWYRLADLRKVWVLADLFRDEAEHVKPGTMARVSVPRQKREFHAMVAKVLPQFDVNSRTLKVRLEMDNPDFLLRPDEFVDVEFPLTVPPSLNVPVDAVLDSGLKKTVFVDRGNGYFEPRTVETGWQTGDRLEITKGLMEGERIVVSGNFLIDSESKMKMAAAGVQAASQPAPAVARAIDPVCGMEVSQELSREHRLAVDYKGATYYLCTDECKEKFVRNPDIYARQVVPKKAAAASVPAHSGMAHD